MNIYGTATIQIHAEGDASVSFSKLKRELNEVMDEAAQAVLSKYGIENDEVWTVIINDLDQEEDYNEKDNE